jgi:putative salt-induced outer membrane protein YdiY
VLDNFRSAVWKQAGAGVRQVLALLIVMWFAAPAVAHDKTDVVTLKNGDRFTGEIKGVAQETLELDTDAAGTLKLEWTHVASVTSLFNYEVETTTGERYFGSFDASGKAGELLVAGDDGKHTVPLSEVFSISPLGRDFWKRLNGNVNLGFSYTQSNRAVQYSLSAATHYQNRKYLAFGQLNSIFNNQEGVDSTKQQFLGIRLTRSVKKVSGVYGVFQLQSNPDQGFNLRSVIGGGYDRFLVHRQNGYFIVNAGLVYDREQIVGSPQVDNSAELTAGLQFANFSLDKPNRTITIGFDTFTNVTDTPRFRAQLNLSLTWEIVNNFNLGITLLDSYDTRPPTVEAKTNDMSLSLSVGYSY